MPFGSRRGTTSTDAKPAFTLSASRATSPNDRANFVTSASPQRVTLDDIEEFVEEAKRRANEERARTIGNGLLAVSLAVLAVSIVRRLVENVRERRRGKVEREEARVKREEETRVANEGEREEEEEEEEAGRDD